MSAKTSHKFNSVVCAIECQNARNDQQSRRKLGHSKLLAGAHGDGKVFQINVQRRFACSSTGYDASTFHGTRHSRESVVHGALCVGKKCDEKGEGKNTEN